ncbi:MAG: YggU family protein [Candidatus Altiarchaeales archaeon]|nr:YggU family protein [Candidatus Altiarchaeales archaeon]MBD3416748.1 YggU family protein [Candidatus Altiarchaeales archaeon]
MKKPSLRISDSGVIFEVRVTPSAREEGVSLEEGVIRVRTRAPADKGKANKAVVQLLKEFFGPCEIVGGQRSRKKTVKTGKRDEDGFYACLEALGRGQTV